MFVTRNVFHKYHSPQDGEGGDGGGGSANDGGDNGNNDGGDGGTPPNNGGDGGDEGKGGKPSGGARKMSDEEARLLKENMKKKEQLDKAQNEAKSLKEQLKAFEGIDPTAVRKLLADQKTAEEKALEAKGDWERLKTRMAEEHGKEVTTLQSQIEALQNQLNTTKGTINELTVGTQFSQSQFIADELTLTPAKARVIYGEHFELEDGKMVAYDKPRGAANRTALVDAYGNAVSFDEALRKIVEADPEKDHLLKSKVKPGAGSDSKKPVQNAKPETDTDSINKIAAGLKGLKF
jgi:hypothetical protein